MTIIVQHKLLKLPWSPPQSAGKTCNWQAHWRCG